MALPQTPPPPPPPPGRHFKRREIAGADVAASVEGIRRLAETSPLSLRLSGQLLLGTTRVHVQQVGGAAAHLST